MAGGEALPVVPRSPDAAMTAIQMLSTAVLKMSHGSMRATSTFIVLMYRRAFVSLVSFSRGRRGACVCLCACLHVVCVWVGGGSEMAGGRLQA